MSKRDNKRVKLSDFKDRKRDEGAIDIEGDDGTVFRIEPPELWPDEVHSIDASKDPVAFARALLGGEERYAAFVAAGGTAGVLAGILDERHGTGTGESSASSRS